MKAIGYENLTKPDISDAVQQAMEDRSERTQVTQDGVIEEDARGALLASQT